MAVPEPKSSFLGSISPWSISRGATPSPKPILPEDSREGDTLKQSSRLDHSVSLRPSPSLRHYPGDCPPLKPRWFYAVDIPKRKPHAANQSSEQPSIPPPVPKKLVPFSLNDSQTLESAFQSLDKDDTASTSQETSTTPGMAKIPVNEDFLFDVDIEKRELEPAYWLGPVYEVRRGSWFYQEGSTLRPCDENLANQLEEGYLKIAPWRKSSLQVPRSASQPRSRPKSLILDGLAAAKAATPRDGSPQLAPADERATKADPESSRYRLFGVHMNTTVTYQDSTTAWLTSDDFMSRMSSTVYGRFGTLGGTKVVRGFSESGTAPDSKSNEPETPKDLRRRSAPPGSAQESEAESTPEALEEKVEELPLEHKRSALQRQLSSLAGIPGAQSSEDLAEEARQEEEKEMEDYRETNASEQEREIEHLVLVTHGIGQRLGLRLDSINFVHDVNTLRKTMKAVYASAPDLQVLNSQVNEMPSNCRVQVLPVCWRHLLDFPRQSVKQNRKEFDLGDADGMDEDDYPSLADITVDGVPAVRNLITDLAMDILLYQSAYREHIAGIVQRECNRVFKLFKQRNPNFSGRVSLCGHSLGSAILFDILCRQKETRISGTSMRMPSKGSKDKTPEQRDLRLDFECENFFCLGSPIALFQMLKGRTISGRRSPDDIPVESPFDPDDMYSDPFAQALASAPASEGGATPHLLPITTSSPKCSGLYNIFHPTDPIAYRLEPLISPAMASLKPQPLPYTKKGLFDGPGIANIGARMGQSVGSMWYSLTSGVASSLINRSLGITGEEQALPQDGASAKQPLAMQGLLNKASGASDVTLSSIPVADGKKQQALADAAKSSLDPDHLPTLIDSELETLYAGFQKRQRSHNSTTSDEASQAEIEELSERARKMKREEAKVRALNSNGRVDYSIQEGVFDISLLASIASHLSYWADEDVNHFMVSQMLKRAREKDKGAR